MEFEISLQVVYGYYILTSGWTAREGLGFNLDNSKNSKSIEFLGFFIYIMIAESFKLDQTGIK